MENITTAEQSAEAFHNIFLSEMTEENKKAPTPRRKKATRNRKKTGPEFTDRDRDLLQFIGIALVVRKEQVAAFFEIIDGKPMQAETGSKRLKRLMDFKLVVKHADTQTGPAVFTLSLRGHKKAIADKLIRPTEGLHSKPKAASVLLVTHRHTLAWAQVVLLELKKRREQGAAGLDLSASFFSEKFIQRAWAKVPVESRASAFRAQKKKVMEYRQAHPGKVLKLTSIMETTPVLVSSSCFYGDGKTFHDPDGFVIEQGADGYPRAVAIEVEISKKQTRELRAIFLAYSAAAACFYSVVRYYVAGEASATRIRKVWDEVRPLGLVLEILPLSRLGVEGLANPAGGVM